MVKAVLVVTTVAAECGGILLQKIDGLRPVSHTFSQTHLKPLLPSLYFLHSLATGTLHILPRLIRRPEQSPLESPVAALARDYFFSVRI
jgi:hypothetical protein